MREVRLVRPEMGTGSIHMHKVVTALEKMKAQRVRVYSTFPRSQSKAFCLLTTSKDVHLRLGSMTDTERFHFASLLEEEMAQEPSKTLIIIGDDEEKGILVTLGEPNGKGPVFHLSPAN